MPIIDVNNDALVRLSNRLEKMHRSAFPVAVRQTLNKAAFFTKQKTLQIEARKRFIVRKPSFFRAFSKVDKASGFKVSKMQSIVGMTNANESSRNLKYQERGGTIQNRSFIATKAARTGKSNKKVIARRNKLANVEFVKMSRSGGSKKQRFVKAAITAAVKYGKRAHVLTDTSLVRIDRALTNVKSRKLNLKTTKIYDYKKGRAVRINKAPFVGPAAQRTSKLMPKWFNEEAEKQFKKLRK